MKTCYLRVYSYYKLQAACVRGSTAPIFVDGGYIISQRCAQIHISVISYLTSQVNTQKDFEEFLTLKVFTLWMLQTNSDLSEN